MRACGAKEFPEGAKYILLCVLMQVNVNVIRLTRLQARFLTCASLVAICGADNRAAYLRCSSLGTEGIKTLSSRSCGILMVSSLRSGELPKALMCFR